METGRTEEERSTVGTAARGKREEGKRKSGRLSSQKQAEADERKRKAGRKAPEEKRTKGSGNAGKHRWNGCGSETGRDERKRTGSQVPETGDEAWETRRRKRWKTGKPKGRTGALEKPLRGEDGKKGKEETESQVAGSGTEADERKRKGSGKTESESRR